MAATKPSVVRRSPKPGRRSPADNSPVEPQRGQRRPLSHVGGKVSFRGPERELEAVLGQALSVSSSEREVRAHVHGFHSYPARLHPRTASGLVEGLSRVGDVVLDPFCGSGTVLVEASLLGRPSIGVDANPLSVLLARVKTTRCHHGLRGAISKQAELAMGTAQERRRVKAPPHKRYADVDRQWFDTHVLLELDSLRHELTRIADARVRAALQLVLSSVLTKVSLKAGDSSARQVGKRIASGYTIRHFGDRTRELLRQLEEFDALAGRRSAPARVLEGDARQLGGVEASSVSLVVSSPPYPGVFDYLEHHELRLRWLGLDTRSFSRNEIGSRRQMERLGDTALQRWQSDLSKALSAIGHVLQPGALACLVFADSVVAGRAVWADELLLNLAPRANLELAGIASQKRPYFHRATAEAFGGRPRREHVVVLRKAQRS